MVSLPRIGELQWLFTLLLKNGMGSLELKLVSWEAESISAEG